MKQEETLLDETEAAQFLHVSKQWLQKQRHGKSGPPYVRLGGRKRGNVRYRPHCLVQYLDAQTVEGVQS